MQIRLIRKLAHVLNGIDLSRRVAGEIIDLPLPDARMLIVEGWAEALPWGERHARVLIVEDDRPMREFYRAGMAGRFVVDECADGLAALAYFDRNHPDAVVLDLNLPRLHGLTLYNELRGQPLTADIPIVVVTGVDPPPTIAGATVLRKPCDVSLIVNALELAMTLGGGA